MKNSARGKRVIDTGRDRLTISELWRRKARFHQTAARLPFEEKMDLVLRLQEIAGTVRSVKNKS